MNDLDEDERAHFVENIAWLGAASPDDWHRVALEFNWCYPLYLLDWIVRQEACDRATALTIFWKCDPECWMEEEGESKGQPNGYSWLSRQMCTYIAGRVASGGYARSEIAFAPDTWTKHDYLGLVAHEQTLARPNFRTHRDLIKRTKGRVVDLNSDFYRRYPEQFHMGYFDEALADDLENGRYFTAKTASLWAKLQKIERDVWQRLPAWLKA